jgi:hypothetical protein
MESGAQVPEALGSPRMGMAGEIHSLDRSGGTAAPRWSVIGPATLEPGAWADKFGVPSASGSV